MSDEPRSAVDRRAVFGETPEGIERIAPGFFPPHIEREHLARYRWAARWVGGMSVLDVACGTGYGSALVLRAGARRVVAVDHSVPALTFGRGRYPGVRYLLADAGALPLRAGSADVVISLETLEHLVDALPFLRALRGIVRGDGVLLVSTPNAAQTDGSNPYHVHEMALPELLELLAAAGFRAARVWGQFWRLPSRRGLWRLRGMGRLAHEIARRPEVVRLPRALGLAPLYWCVLARPAGSPP